MDINDLKKLLKPADLLLIIPPFYRENMNSLGAHVLQACCREAGFSVQIFYANILFASRIKEEYEKLCKLNYTLPGERIFAKAAFGDQCRDVIHENIYNDSPVFGSQEISRMQFSSDFIPPPVLSLAKLKEIEKIAYEWVEEISRLLAQMPYKIIGCSSTFEQINSSFALLKKAKKNNPDIVTLIGGANCEAQSAQGIMSLDPDRKVIDYIFSGESENSLVEFLVKFKNGIKNENRIIVGKPYQDMDSLPEVNYSQYFEQLYSFLPYYVMGRKHIQICYETSRGCWWGEKKHCLFCGLNKERMTFRQKSASRVLKDLRGISKLNTKYLQMMDTIMPDDYFKTLLPELAKEDHGFTIFYEIKANLSYQKLKLLKNAGITELQPGIESFSDTLLRQMNKGVSGRQNIQLLRDALVLNIKVEWFILWGLPNEKLEEYEEMLGYLPLLSHLQPPVNMAHLGLTRFSPYFMNHEQHGIKKIRPINSYQEIFPGYADIENIAYFFTGDYKAETYENSAIIPSLYSTIARWKEKWRSPDSRPVLHLSKQSEEEYILTDTRDLPGTASSYVIDKQKAANVLQHGKYTESGDQKWAVQNKAGLVFKNRFVSLVTADSDLIEEFN